MVYVDIEPLVAKYALSLMVIVLLFLGAILVDRMRRLSRFLRIMGYLLIISLVAMDYFCLNILNELTYPFLLLLGSVGLAVTIYSEGYSRVLLGTARTLQLPLEILSISLYLLFTSTYLIEFVIFWILTELIGFMIILFEGTREAWKAAITYLVIGALTADLSLFTMLAVVAQAIGLENIFTITIYELSGLSVPYTPFLTILLLLGFIAKSALVPFHFWLPNAYTVAPSPATSLFSGVMEKMSIFGVLIVFHLLSIDKTVAGYALIILGFITTIYAATQAVLQSDAKRLLSYSTMGYSGCLMNLVGLYILTNYSSAVFVALILLMFSHGISKSLLFMNVGSMEILANTRNIYDLGYLARIDRVGAITIVIGSVSLLGIPSTIGFTGKFSAFLAGVTSFFDQGIVSLPYIISLSYLSSIGIVYILKFIGSYYGGYKPMISGIYKYPIMNIGEIINGAIVFLYGVLGSVLLYRFTGSIYVIVFNIVLLAIICIGLVIVLQGKIKFREDEAWVGGAYP
ncbi:MAG: hypothetical protein J7L82_06695 [Staphylothermus sp.]|nr:hypothetical protein [Staphylothermus sp.]